MKAVRKGIPFRKLLASLPREQQEAIRIRSQEFIEQELTLRDLRKAIGQTHAAMSAKLGVKRENVSRVEQRTDVMLSMLNGYLGAMGGRLKLVVEFDGRPPVIIRGFGLAAEGDDEPTIKLRRKKATV